MGEVRLFRVATLAFLVFLMGLAQVGAASALYTGEAFVNSQSDVDRSQALKSAFAQVMTQMSGVEGILSRPGIAKAVAEADKYVLQYQYRQNTAGIDGEAAPFILVAQFDRVAIDRLLQEAGSGSGQKEAVQNTLTDMTIWVDGLQSADDYARLLSYMSGLDVVRTVQIQEARGKGLLLKLRVTLDMRSFLDVIDAERVLQVVHGQSPVEGIDATLRLSS